MNLSGKEQKSKVRNEQEGRGSWEVQSEKYLKKYIFTITLAL